MDPIATLLCDSGGNYHSLKQSVNRAVSGLPKVRGGTQGRVYLTASTERLLEKAYLLAIELGDEFVSVEIILLALVLDADNEASRLLKTAGVDVLLLEAAIKKMRKGRMVDSSSPMRVTTRSHAIRAISRHLHGRVNLTPLLVETRRYAAPFRFCLGGQKTTRS